MKDKYKISKDFILEAHKIACLDWKAKIEKEVPELFKKDELEVGRWYKIKNLFNGCLGFNGLGMHVEGDVANNGLLKSTKGYLLQEPNGCIWRVNGDFELATEEEVKEALIKEAEKKGYKTGNYKCLTEGTTFSHSDEYSFEEGKLYTGWNNNKSRNIVFKEGKWAEIIKETKVSQSELEAFYKEQKGIDNLVVV